ncbi:MAG: undecaprenyl-diphosphate phosphatase [Abditibacteriales bacterium]|nr:undecaprenyl-diphosphate phosphatase [Abditibacteriales bacterium]MDW8367959.1 undecaprenyl-diphosphate phosphatase [Abditibacteriales bacterium]
MNWWQSVFLGVVQGLTEFIPVSSSAHLALAHHFFDWHFAQNQNLLFDVATHFGTLLALLVYFRHEWLGLLFDPKQRPLLKLVLLGCVPGGVFGIVLSKLQLEEKMHDLPLLMAACLAVMGVVMWLVDRAALNRRTMEEMTTGNALAIGCSQALALIPGVSRSGITITTGLLIGFTRETAARYSFLMSAPIVFGAALWEARKLKDGLPDGAMITLVLGILSAAVAGYLAIGFLLNYLRRSSLAPFVVYRIVLAVVVVIVYFLQSH